MLGLYWGLLITGILFAVVTVLLGDLLSNALDGMLDFLAGEHLQHFHPTVLVSGITIIGGAGIMLNTYTAMSAIPVFLLSLLCGILISLLVYVAYVRPMEHAENSVAFSMNDLAGKIGEVIVPIPIGGYGEVLVRAGAGQTNQIAASFEGEEIETGARVVTVEVKDHTLYVVRLDKE